LDPLVHTSPRFEVLTQMIQSRKASLLAFFEADGRTCHLQALRFSRSLHSQSLDLGARRVMSPQKTPDVKRIKGVKDHQRSSKIIKDHWSLHGQTATSLAAASESQTRCASASPGTCGGTQDSPTMADDVAARCPRCQTPTKEAAGPKGMTYMKVGSFLARSSHSWQGNHCYPWRSVRYPLDIH
jgi:hypothetical protein